MMIAQLITSFIASAAFGVIFNVPKNSLLQCGFVGMLGWILYFALVENGINSIIATLASAFIVAVISQYFAKGIKRRSRFSMYRESSPRAWRVVV